jgi:hypothetical protein
VLCLSLLLERGENIVRHFPNLEWTTHATSVACRTHARKAGLHAVPWLS